MQIGLQLYHQLTPFEIAAKSAEDVRSKAIPRFWLFVSDGVTRASIVGVDFSLQPFMINKTVSSKLKYLSIMINSHNSFLKLLRNNKTMPTN